MSFGGGGFGSSGFGTNNNTNQSGSLFGGASSGSAFGSNSNNTGGFGSTSTGGFGSNTNSGGGLFGGSSTGMATNNNTSGFGSGGFGSNTNTGGSLFGGNNNNNNNNRSAFGGGNTSGGGLFGNSSGSGGFGGGSGFGSGSNNNNATSAFGSSAGGGGGSLFGNNASSGFGTSNNNNTSTGTGMFGGSSNNTTSAFGGGGSGFGGGATSGFGSGASATQNAGTGSTPFQPFVENDGAATNVKAHYQSLSFQDPYKNFSFEELRQVDYDQGRKYGNQNGQAGAFGAASTFGGQTTSGGFGSGSTGGFGGGGFGTSNTNNNNSAAGGFGSSTGGFGSNTNSTGGGLFSSANKPAGGGGLFGNSATSTQQSGGGLFGTAGNNNSGGFGSSNTAGGFGSANKPGGLFGGGSNTTGGFGSSSTTTGGGLFGGQNNQNNNTNQTNSAFGGGSAFGSAANNNNQAQSTSGGLFGGGFGNNANSNNAQQKSIFGGGNATGGNSLFGNSQSTTNNNASGGLFGQSNQQNNTGSSLFGNKPASGGGLFGGNTQQNNQGGGGLFGQNNQQNNQSGGLFGGQNKGLFGGSTTQNNNTGGGSSLFGGSLNTNNQQQNQGGLFGNSTQNQNTGGSLFGNSQQPLQQSQQLQQLTASLTGPAAYGNEHLFAGLASSSPVVGPLATPLSRSQKPRRPAPLPAYKLNPAASTRLITPQKKQSYGFSYSTYGTPGSAYGGSPLSGSLFSPSLSRTLTKSSSAGSLRGEDSILNVNAFSPGARSARSSGSMKKLQINRNIRTDLFDDPSNVLRASPLKKAVSFDDNPTETAPPNGSTSTALVRVEDDSPSPEDMGYLRSSTSRSGPNGSGSNGSARSGSQSATPEGEVTGKELATVSDHRRTVSREEAPASKSSQGADRPLGEYWMQPSAHELRRMSSQQLANIEQFTVGRTGAGKIEFHNVDLTNVPLDEIVSGLVRFAHRGVTVYADHDNKPPQGKGLNVPARVYLENSWPRSHGGRIRVYEKSGPKIEKHIERLSRIPNTKLVKFETDTGTWIFDVEHFSTYELYDEDDTMSDSMPGSMEDATSPLAMKRGVRRAFAPEPSSSLGVEAPVQPDFGNIGRRSLPGGFDDEALVEAIHTSEMHGSNQPSFLDDAMHGGETQDMAFQEMTEVSKPYHSSAVNGNHGEVFTENIVDQPYESDQDRDMDVDVAVDVEPEAPRHTPTRNLAFQPRSILKSGTRPFSGTPARRQNLIDEDNWAGQLQRTISPKKQDRKVLREAQDLGLQELPPLEPTTDQNKVPFANSMDIMNSLFGAPKHASNSKKQSSSDKDLQWPAFKRSKRHNASDETFDQAFHASFKPRWTADGTLVTASHSLMNKMALTLRGSRMNLLPNTDEVGLRAIFKKPAISQSFEKQRSLSVVDTQDGVPRAHLPAKFSFADFASAVAADRNETNKDEQDVWQLAQILFDSQDPFSNEQAMRKQMLIQFWKSVVTSSALTHAQKASTPEEKAIACLSAFDIWGATEALLDGNDARLSLLVSQLDSEQRKTLQADVEQQIKRWRSTRDLSEIPARIRALYDVVSGNVFISEGVTDPLPENQAETFNIAKKFGLDWRRAFGLRLWYGTLKQESVSDAIQLYEEQLQTGRDEPRPQPWFAKKTSHPSALVDVRDERQDVLYGLLRLFNDDNVDLSEVLNPDNLSSDCLDVMLAFQLYQALSVRGIAGAASESTSFSDDLTEKLTAHLSTDASTMPQAFFAALHFSQAGPRARAIKTLLERFAGDIHEPSDEFTYMTQTLQIPASWIWAAKAQHALAVEGSASLQALYLLRAGEAEKAHEVLYRVVGPQCVVEESISGLGNIVATFKDSAAGKLTGWRKGGAIYGDFAELVEKSGGPSAVVAGGRPRFAPGALADTHQICRRLRAVVPKGEAWALLSLQERAACSEMERVVRVVEHEIEALRAGTGEIGAERMGGEADITSLTGMPADTVLAGAEEASDAYYLRAQLAV